MSKLDEWLGRASLKDRIEELEAETDRLRRRYEAESDRRAEAVRERQSAEERVNRLEDRIAQLEGELDRADSDDSRLDVRRHERLRGERLADVLDRLTSMRTAPEGALTAGIADEGVVPDDVEALLDDRAALAAEAAPCLVCADDAGVVSVALSPSVPVAVEPTWSDRFELPYESFRPSGRFALVLVRTDLFALGVYEGDERVTYRGFESDVKSAHSKGGFSQARFERIRNDQIDDHLKRAQEATAEALEEAGVDRWYLVGQHGPIDAVADELAANRGTEPAATAAVDATGTPEPALADAFRSFWTADLYVL